MATIIWSVFIREIRVSYVLFFNKCTVTIIPIPNVHNSTASFEKYPFDMPTLAHESENSAK